MKTRRWAAWAVGACVAIGLPTQLHAQGTATTGTGSTGSSSTTSGATGSSSTGGGGASSNTLSSGINLTAPSNLVAPVAIRSFTNSNLSATSSPSNANIFGATFINPYSLGQPSNFANTLGPYAKTTGIYGKGLYLNNPTTTGNSTGSTTTGAGNGFNVAPIPRAPQYITVLGEGLAAKQFDAPAMQANLQSKFTGSKAFKNGAAIRVDYVNGVAILRGDVASETERARAEGMMSITRGVNGVQNELRVVNGQQ